MNNQNDEYETLEELEPETSSNTTNNQNNTPLQTNNNTSNFFQMPEQEVLPPKEKSKIEKLFDKIKGTIKEGVDDIEDSLSSNKKTDNTSTTSSKEINQNIQNNNQFISNNTFNNSNNNQSSKEAPLQTTYQSSQEQFFYEQPIEPKEEKKNDEPPKRGKFFGFLINNQEENKEEDKEDNIQPWMNNQPLSMDTLGVTASTNDEEIDETANSRFLNPSAFEGSKGIVDRSLNLPKLKQKKERSNNGTLLLNYLGEDYNRISMNPFSMSALLTGGLYLFNHKVRLLGLILFALEIYILVFMPIKIAIISIIIYVLVLGFASNEIILLNAKMKVALIRKFHPKDHEVLLVERASKKGGTNLFLTLIIFALGIAFSVYAIGYKDYNNGLIGKGITFAQNKIYDLMHPFTIAFDSGVNVEDKFNITIPKDMTKQEGTTFYYAYKEKYMEINLCTYEFGLLRTYTDMDEFLSLLKKEYKIETTEEIEINNIKWQTATLINDDGTKTWRATTLEDRIFLMISYQNINDTSKICETYFDEIYSSISQK